MKKQMKAIDLHARKLGDEHLVPGGRSAGAILAFPLGPFLLELGQRNPTVLTLWRIAKALGVKPRQFFDEEKPSRRVR